MFDVIIGHPQRPLEFRFRGAAPAAGVAVDTGSGGEEEQEEDEGQDPVDFLKQRMQQKSPRGAAGAAR